MVDNSYTVQMELNEIREQQIQMILGFTDQIEEVVVEAGADHPEIYRRLAEDLLLRLQFAPLGDNHHNASLCPYCTPGER